MPPRGATPEDAALSLTSAVVLACPAPVLLLDSDLCIVAASTVFHEAVGRGQVPLAGVLVFQLQGGIWDCPQMHSLLDAVRAGGTPNAGCDLDVELGQTPARRVRVSARRLDYLDLDQIRILVTLSDCATVGGEPSFSPERARQDAILLQEVRHRVANSLQLIAGVLLRNARKSTSEEARRHLTNAHHRVMSVAALERLLSTAEEGEIQIHAYLVRLCDSITTSMIDDFDNVTLTVEAGDGVIDARVSVGMGLIITELVINALKYAFPHDQAGSITVHYRGEGADWTLGVRDNGIGMPTDADIRSGLGTSIVKALAAQLEATVSIRPGEPGTQVLIKHIGSYPAGDGSKGVPDVLTRQARSRPGTRERPDDDQS